MAGAEIDEEEGRTVTGTSTGATGRKGRTMAGEDALSTTVRVITIRDRRVSSLYLVSGLASDTKSMKSFKSEYQGGFNHWKGGNQYAK